MTNSSKISFALIFVSKPSDNRYTAIYKCVNGLGDLEQQTNGLVAIVMHTHKDFESLLKQDVHLLILLLLFGMQLKSILYKIIPLLTV